jgi:predicted transcriptional regulator YdeE
MPQGANDMSAKMTAFKVVEMPAFKVVGKELRVKMGMPEGNPIPAFWDKCFQDGTMAQLDKLPGRLYPNVYLGWMGRWNPQDNTFSYIVGVAAQPDAPAEGMDTAETPASKFAVATVAGTEPEIYGKAHEFLEGEMKARALPFNEAVPVEIEWYGENFMADPVQKEIDLLMAVK